MDLTRHRNLIAVLVFLGLAVMGLYLNARARGKRTGAMAVLQCVDLYARATTAAESSAVDAVHPIQAETEETTCLTLRIDGSLDRQRSMIFDENR